MATINALLAQAAALCDAQILAHVRASEARLRADGHRPATITAFRQECDALYADAFPGIMAQVRLAIDGHLRAN